MMINTRRFHGGLFIDDRKEIRENIAGVCRAHSRGT